MKKINLLPYLLVFLLIFQIRTIVTAESYSDRELPIDVNQTNTTTIRPMDQTTLFSKNLNLDWTYEVYLPASYEESPDQTYPVFYLMHGVYGSVNNWRNVANLFANADALSQAIGKEFIIVSIDGLNSFYIDKNINMESAIIQELLPEISSKYRISNTRETTFVGGLSMGGYGAARLALKYPDIFGGAILLSPAVWEAPNAEDGSIIYESMGIYKDANGDFDQRAWDDYHPASLIESYSSNNQKVRFYIATGEEDDVVNIKNIDTFVDKLKGKAEVEYVVKKELGHEWALWKEQILCGIMYCLE